MMITLHNAPASQGPWQAISLPAQTDTISEEGVPYRFDDLAWGMHKFQRRRGTLAAAGPKSIPPICQDGERHGDEFGA